MAKGHGKVPSQRQLRVGEELRHALAEVLGRGDLRDPGLSGTPVTVTEVRVSPDLRNATAFVVPLGGGDTETVLAALARATPYLRAQVARLVRLKFAPDFAFRADTSFDQASDIDSLLHEPCVAADVAAGGGERSGGA
ncbi:MAG: 30S ribosome-binding factor RbfA [Alphaproteobacteria bacterium]